MGRGDERSDVLPLVVREPVDLPPGPAERADQAPSCASCGHTEGPHAQGPCALVLRLYQRPDGRTGIDACPCERYVPAP